jgi:mxaJ protein
MYSSFLRVWLLATFTLATAHAAAPLRICADPDNLPFSNSAGQGFDNRIGALVAHELGRQPQFVWARNRRGFLREQFNKNACDVLMGVPQGMRGVATTQPYYRSTYVFVTRTRDRLQIASFDDPQLNGRRIGLQMLEEDMAPPSLPLIRSGHAAQLVGFDSFGDGPARLLRAVADGHLGAAVAWGPVAGYFAHRQNLSVTLTPVRPAIDRSGVPFVFSLTLAVHPRDVALRVALDTALYRLRRPIQRILTEDHVPIVGQNSGAI